MTEYTEDAIIASARERLLKRGVKVVCTDLLHTEPAPHTVEDFERLVELVVLDTLYWEGKL